jgi:pimeloyl-ACP methyl ester carboxylesterase
VFTVQRQGQRLTAYDYTSQGPVRLRMYVVLPTEGTAERQVMYVAADNTQWQRLLTTLAGPFLPELADEGLPAGGAADTPPQAGQRGEATAVVLVAPRGVGPAAFDPAERKQVQYRRRFYLLGQTLEGMQIWDLRRAIAASGKIEPLATLPLTLVGEQTGAALALYAAIYEPSVAKLHLVEPPLTHAQGPYLLNISRVFEVPQAVALAAETRSVLLQTSTPDAWDYPRGVAGRLGWPTLQIVAGPQTKEPSP